MNLATKFWLMLLLLQVIRPATATTVTNVAAGAYHSLFLKSDGSLWATGSNKYGQLGDGTTNDVHRPELIVSNVVTAIAAGYGHSLFLKSDGSLWAMGLNDLGELGDGTTNNAKIPKQIVSGGVLLRLQSAVITVCLSKPTGVFGERVTTHKVSLVMARRTTWKYLNKLFQAVLRQLLPEF